MKRSRYKVPTWFGPDSRFELQPTPAAPFRAVVQTRFDQLQRRLLTERLGKLWEPGLNSSVRRAANEAAALAWLSSYPLLVFPVLFEEKAEAALSQAARQTQVRRRSRELLGV